jgi:hypothetical protein
MVHGVVDASAATLPTLQCIWAQRWGSATRRGVLTDGREDECVSAGLRPSRQHYLRFRLRAVWVQIGLTEAILALMSAGRHDKLALDLQEITLFEVCTWLK